MLEYGLMHDTPGFCSSMENVGLEESFYYIIEQCIRNTNFFLNECSSRFSASTRYAIELNPKTKQKTKDKIFSMQGIRLALAGRPTRRTLA